MPASFFSFDRTRIKGLLAVCAAVGLAGGLVPVINHSHATYIPSADTIRVIDGGTLSIDDEHIRLSGLDAPRIAQAACADERYAGQRARQLMQIWVEDASRVDIDRVGVDADGRKLVHVALDGWDLGDMLVRHSLARPAGAPNARSWCA